MHQATAPEAALRKDRALVLAGLVGVVGLAWAYMAHLAVTMDGMADGMAMPSMQSWGPADAGLMFLMWAVMMAAMMVPAAAPVILLFATANRRRHTQQRPFVPTAVFLLGYWIVWVGFAALATGGQWALNEAALLSSTMGSATPIAGGAILVSAGVYQLTPLKDVCLRHCRTPFAFLMSEWRDGRRGAVVMGLRHGTFCLGCCWALMGLMFVGGVMKLAWMAGVAAYVLVEKVAGEGHWIGRATGLSLVAWGLWTLARSLGLS